MRRKLFIVLSLVVLMSMVATTAFAAEPAATDQTIVFYGGEWMLGEVVEDIFIAFDPVTNEILPYHPVDVWLYRPDTVYGADLNLGFDPMFPANWNPADYIKPAWESALRRQSWPKYTESSFWGFYYFKFMLPRDEVWYPCSFPCKWQCNYYQPMLGWDFHSPKMLWFSYADAWTLSHQPLFWPWDIDWVDPFFPILGFINPYGPPPFYEYYWYPLGQVATPFDTVHPMQLWITDAASGYAMYIAEMQILGYRWRTSDLKVGEYGEDWPYLCGGPFEFPDYDNLGTPWPWGW
jgi:hypothetical protein